ncbi:MAG TPA: GMC family oxidoreductase [Polyangiaceae bacterium]|nr:GMC family oxidoreductase [Polyangiaceae bacterium]
MNAPHDRPDVIVVGAGPAGLLAAERLEARGRRVLLLEAGPAAYGARTDERDPAWRYRALGGACWWPRAHAVGGRANLWGGWLSRFGPEVFLEGGWPYGARALAPYYAAAEAWLGAAADPLDDRFVRAARELGVPVRPRLRARAPDGTHWTGAHCAAAAHARTGSVALRLELPAGGPAAVIVDRGGAIERLEARAVVLAASAIETTRLLLASGVRHRRLGRGLTDHFNLSYLLVEPNRPADPDARGLPPAAFVPRFVNRGAASKRPYRGGYSVEIVGPLPLARLDEDVRALVADQAPPDASFTFVNSLGEQWRAPGRYVDLAPRARDALGRPLPQIHLASSAAERRLVEDMKASCRRVAEAIASPGASLLRYRDPFVLPPVFHPAGTCAMGEGPGAPCDPWGRLRPAPSVWVADASAFPSAGDCHPTLTVLAHALRVVESVDRALGGPAPKRRPPGPPAPRPGATRAAHASTKGNPRGARSKARSTARQTTPG